MIFFTSVHVQFVGYNLKVSQFRHVCSRLITSNTTHIFTECITLKPTSLCRLSSSGMTFVQSCVKMDQNCSNFSIENTYTAWWSHKPTIFFPFLKEGNSKLKACFWYRYAVCVRVCMCVSESQWHTSPTAARETLPKCYVPQYVRYIARKPPQCQFLSFLKSVKTQWLT